MIRILLLLLVFSTTAIQAQIVGKVTDTKGEPLPFVNIYLEDTYDGTTSNDDGDFELNIAATGNYTVVFQFFRF